MVALAGRPDHCGALRHGDLGCGTAYASGCSLDEKGAPWEAAQRLGPAHPGHGGQAGAGRLLVAEAGGIASGIMQRTW